MEGLSAILRDATAAVGPEYFQLEIDGGAPVYRERVYCYELYHQMRRLWPAGSFRLNGEVNKVGHPIFRDLDAELVPDFLVHTPGDMAGNNTIIEVKQSLAPANGLRKDLETLDLFVTRAQYRRAIYLIYGFEADDQLIRRLKTIARAPVPIQACVEVWLHSCAGQAARHADSINPAELTAAAPGGP